MKSQGTDLVVKPIFLLFIFGVIVFWGFQVSGQEWTDEQKEVWKSVEAYWGHLKQGDAEAVMAGFHDDYVEWWPEKKLPLGKDLMEMHYKSWLYSLSKPVSYEIEPLSIHIYGDVANVFYMYKGDKGGVVPSSRYGRGMETFLKQENKWILTGAMEDSCTKLPSCE